jgi:hypothetical protein
MECSCEGFNDPSAPATSRIFLEQMSVCQFLKMESTPWNYCIITVVLLNDPK